MYKPLEHENEILDWLSKHLVEMGLGILVAFMVWESNLLLELKHGQTVNNLKIEHIDKAVNNAGQGEDTLREMVEKIRSDVEVLKDRTTSRYDK